LYTDAHTHCNSNTNTNTHPHAAASDTDTAETYTDSTPSSDAAASPDRARLVSNYDLQEQDTACSLRERAVPWGLASRRFFSRCSL
jgi:hypothetical protein